MLHLEMLQLAESIVRVKGNREDGDIHPPPAYFQANLKRDRQVHLLSFDKALHLPDVWVSASELAAFNRLRLEMANK